MNKYFIAIILSIISFGQAATFQLLKEGDEAYSHIAYVCDEEGKHYVLKQIKESEFDQQFGLVLDCLGVFIAQRISIAINTIQIIPPDIDHVGKQLKHLPATLHSLAPGIVLTEHTGVFGDLDLQQRCRSRADWYWKKYGPLPAEYQGLSRYVIKHMARHPQLPALVALDTFTGNRDRSRPNLFYDKNSNSFCAIDMGESYKYNLCKEAICHLLRLHQQGYVFCTEERNALKVYQNTLKILTETCPPELVCQKLTEFTNQAGFCLERNRKATECFAGYKHMIRASYQDALALLELLELIPFPCHATS